MSYDISLYDPDTGAVGEFLDENAPRGGTYVLGGSREAHLNVTYNYSDHFYSALGERGIRTIYGRTGEESIPILEAAIDKLGTDENDDYWKSTEGNAREALKNLLWMASRLYGCIWDGD